MKTILLALTVLTITPSAKVFASPPPFMCTAFIQWELDSKKDLTESEITSRKNVLSLFQDATTGTGPSLDLLKNEIAKKNPNINITNSEIAERLIQINSIGYSESPCFDMIAKGLSFTAELIKP